jgi:hypothetical protein
VQRSRAFVACASTCGYGVEYYWAENEGFGPGGLGIELLGLVVKNGSLTLQNLCVLTTEFMFLVLPC